MEDNKKEKIDNIIFFIGWIAWLIAGCLVIYDATTSSVPFSDNPEIYKHPPMSLFTPLNYMPNTHPNLEKTMMFLVLIMTACLIIGILRIIDKKFRKFIIISGIAAFMFGYFLSYII